MLERKLVEEQYSGPELEGLPEDDGLTQDSENYNEEYKNMVK